MQGRDKNNHFLSPKGHKKDPETKQHCFLASSTGVSEGNQLASNFRRPLLKPT